MIGIFNRNSQPKTPARVEVNQYSYRNADGRRVNVPAHERTVYRNQVDEQSDYSEEIESLKGLIREQNDLIAEQREVIKLLKEGGGGDWRAKAEWSDVVIDHLVEMVDDSILYRLKGILRSRYNGSIRVAPVWFRRLRDKPKW